tara:strand:- start:2248 stop:2529 length:282 start_codon:yes stop_codon:yes gene_type:complete
MLEKYEELLYIWIENAIESGSDDQMFATGYLQGHIAVVFAQFEQDKHVSLAQLNTAMQHCLQDNKAELEPQDFMLVQDVWQSIYDYFIEHAAA